MRALSFGLGLWLLGQTPAPSSATQTATDAPPVAQGTGGAGSTATPSAPVQPTTQASATTQSPTPSEQPSSNLNAPSAGPPVQEPTAAQLANVAPAPTAQGAPDAGRPDPAAQQLDQLRKLDQTMQRSADAAQGTQQEVAALRQQMQDDRNAQEAADAQAAADQQTRESSLAGASTQLSSLRPDVLHDSSDYDQALESAQSQLDRAAAAGAQGDAIERAQAALDKAKEARENGDLYHLYESSQEAMRWIGRQ